MIDGNHLRTYYNIQKIATGQRMIKKLGVY